MNVSDAAWRSSNLGTRLFAASGRVIAVKLAAVHAAGFADITVAQLALFHVLDRGGTRLTTLATRARLSKASMAELVDRAEAGGMVVRRIDPADARGRIVAATAAGDTLLAALATGLAAAEADTVAAIGPAATAWLREALVRYIAAGNVPPPPTHADWAGANVGRVFALAAAQFTGEVAAAVAVKGFAVTPALLGMARHLDLGGGRQTDLAAAARMTKPAMRELIDRGEALGFVSRHADPADGRARRIAFTPHGLALLDAVRIAIVVAEADFAATVGAAAAVDVARSLAQLASGEHCTDA